MDVELIKAEYKNMEIIWNTDSMNLRSKVSGLIAPQSIIVLDDFSCVSLLVKTTDALFSKGKNKFYVFKSCFSDFYEKYLVFKQYISSSECSAHVSPELQDAWNSFSHSVEIIAAELAN